MELRSLLTISFFLLGGFCLSLIGQPISPRQFNQQMNELARVTALEVGQNEALRSFIKQQALVRFDGDYNFLINPFLEYQLADGNRLGALLLRQAENPEQLLSFIQSQPQLQIAVPVLCREWSLVYAPAVVYQPAAYEEHLATMVPGYNGAGEFIQLAADRPPSVPVIALTINERTDASGQLLDMAIQGPVEPPVIDDDDDGGGDPPPPPPPPPSPPSPTVCYGPDGAWQYLKGIKVTNLNALEHWLNGVPEIRFVFKRIDDESLLYGEDGVIFVPESRKAIDDSWAFFNATLFRWYNEVEGYPQVGPSCLVHISEKDAGNWFFMPINLNFQTVDGSQLNLNFSIKITDKDEIVGGVPTYFEDCDLMLYNPGVLRYRFYRQ